MRTTIRTFTLLAVMSLAACAKQTSTSTTVSGTPVLTQVPAPAAAPAAAYDPAGKWSVALVAQGQSMELVMTLVKNPDGSYGGNFTSDMFPPMTITKATLTGTKMVLTLPVPTGDTATMNISFNGDVMEGDWSMPGDGSKMSGKRI